jgi:two-component system response regulator MprA
MTDGAAVLVVDDDPEIRAALTRALRLDGYDVTAVSNGLKALEAMPETSPDVVVLDLMMPYVGGLEVCRRLRAKGDRTPILVLTARDEVGDRVAGLDAGADDYLVKPFALEELRARLRALLRRSGAVEEVLRFAGLELDTAACRASRGARVLDLTRTEYTLLKVFLRNPNRVLSRDVIFDAVWGYDFGQSSNALWVYISYLRAKLEAGGEPRLIQTVRGLGYVLREEP